MKTRLLVLKLLISLFVGVTMGATTYLCSWINLREHWGFRAEYIANYIQLLDIEEKLELYHQENGTYPEHLGDLRSMGRSKLIDPWNYPYHYRGSEETYDLISFGRDGKPGGEGHDSDAQVVSRTIALKNASSFDPAGRPTLSQFTAASESRPIQRSSALAGILAFAACLVTITRSPPLRLLSLVGLATTLVATGLTSIVISFLDAPSHH